MNYFKHRRLRKTVRHYLHEARHARCMREDVAPAAEIDALRAAEQELRAAWKTRDTAAVEQALEQVGGLVETVYPRQAHGWVREYLEIGVVALAVAMGFRTYFVQPFKIPTGSMQPTLYGITVEEQQGRGWTDVFPVNMAKFILTGQRYVEVKAKGSGPLQGVNMTDEWVVYSVAGIAHKVQKGMPLRVQLGSWVSKGQVIASGLVAMGDHIFVDKVRYNFVGPKRGQIFVFSTDDIPHPQIRKDSFYIKRLAGLPNDAISIDPPYLMVGGEPVTEPYAFRRMYEDPAYPGGYQLASSRAASTALDTAGAQLILGPHEYLPLGDNTGSSLDGRYFGGVPEKNLVGPAFCVYWPLSKRWGIPR